MSSTNRSSAREWHLSDYYRTPKRDILLFLDKFLYDEKIDLNNRNYFILDPCAWWDETHYMSYPAALCEAWAIFDNITTNDIRSESLAMFHKDFTLYEHKNRYDMVITNPPFNISQKIIEKSIQACKEWWFVIMLLRLNYFWWKIRQNFWKKNMPYRVYIHNKRICFTEDWKTDSIEYMHCVWKKWYNPKETKLSLLYSF